MYEVWVDGSVRMGNPGIGGIAIVVKRDGLFVGESKRILEGKVTSNEAEYKAVIEGIILLTTMNTEKAQCTVFTDSSLVVGQVTLDWKVNFPHLKLLKDLVDDLINEVDFPITIKYIPRGQNDKANSIAQNITKKEKRKWKRKERNLSNA